MSASILRFPPRRIVSIRVEREDDAWIVLARKHGWIHGSRAAAIADANELARGFGVTVVVGDRP
jgi:hypothetical protein